MKKASVPGAAEILHFARKLHQKGFLAAADGNISVRRSDRQILITPSGRNKDDLRVKDLAMVDTTGKIIKGKPSSERLMHLEIYRRCPEARAVVHAHPTAAIAWTIAFPERRELPQESMSESLLAVDRFPVAPYARPGTAAMGEVLAPFLPGCRVMILARHGAVSWGEDLEEAYNGIERVEHVARVLLEAKMFGGWSVLPPEEVEALRQIRRGLGGRTL